MAASRPRGAGIPGAGLRSVIAAIAAIADSVGCGARSDLQVAPEPGPAELGRPEGVEPIPCAAVCPSVPPPDGTIRFFVLDQMHVPLASPSVRAPAVASATSCVLTAVEHAGPE